MDAKREAREEPEHIYELARAGLGLGSRQSAIVERLLGRLLFENEIRNNLQAAGFSKITIEKVDKVSVSSTAKEAAFGLTQGGSIYNEIMKRNPAWIDEIKIKVEKELAEKFGAAPMIAPISAVISQAWK